MAVFSLKPRIFRAQGQNGVLWGQSEFTLDPMGWFYHVVWRRAALGTEYEGPVGTLLRYNRSVADNNTNQPVCNTCIICRRWPNYLE